MNRQFVKSAPAVIAVVAIAAAGIFYAKSSVRSLSPQPVPPIKPHNRRAAEGIEGRVIDLEGRPVAGAQVFADRNDALEALLARGITDEQGNFRIDVPEPGTYTVYGSKEEDGYADTMSAFHKEVDIHNPIVTVAQNQVARDVVVRLGPKASRIEGVLTNAITNQPISKATITLRRADNPEIFYMLGPAESKEKGRFKVLVPSVPFTIEVSALGYEKKKLEALLLTRGEVKRFNIALRPAGQAERKNY